MERSFDFIAGEVLLIDKPLGWSSFDVVNKVRWVVKNITKQKNIKVGHAGTLDPLATGMLIICTGKFTKRIDEFQAKEKEYTGTIILGASTASYDMEQEAENILPVDHITDEIILNAVKKFTGKIMQSPPLYSAVSVDGTRAYKIARKGDEQELPLREIEIPVFEITGIERPSSFVFRQMSKKLQKEGIVPEAKELRPVISVNFRVVCSKGTYIRSLARDLGDELECGAFLSQLRRTRIGEFKVKYAMTVEQFEQEMRS